MSAIASLDRRSGQDRRKSSTTACFPLIDKHLNLVTKDRRKIADRRGLQHSANSPTIELAAENERLFLWCRDQIHELGETPEQEFWLGRSPSCDETFKSRYASRKHAKLFKKGKHFILRDHSCNGTYLKTAEHEHYVHNDQIILVASGTISLGIPFTHPNEEIIYFFRS